MALGLPLPVDEAGHAAGLLPRHRRLGDGHELLELILRDLPNPEHAVTLESEHNIRGRPGFDVVGSPVELQAEVPGWPRKSTGKQINAKNDLANAA